MSTRGYCCPSFGNAVCSTPHPPNHLWFGRREGLERRLVQFEWKQLPSAARHTTQCSISSACVLISLRGRPGVRPVLWRDLEIHKWNWNNKTLDMAAACTCWNSRRKKDVCHFSFSLLLNSHARIDRKRVALIAGEVKSVANDIAVYDSMNTLGRHDTSRRACTLTLPL